MDYTATKARRTYGSFEIGNARNARRGLSGQILEEKSRLTKLNTADAPRLLSPRLFSYALLQVKTTGIAAQHDGNPLILPILGRQNPENKNYLENFLKSLKKRLTKQHFSFDDIDGVRLNDPIHIHSYDFTAEDGKLALSLSTRVSTDSIGIAKCLGLNAGKKVETENLIRTLEAKLTDLNRLLIE
ncbi:MAG: hypothetical protein ACLTEK_03215 [Christensenellales bacterium]